MLSTEKVINLLSKLLFAIPVADDPKAVIIVKVLFKPFQPYKPFQIKMNNLKIIYWNSNGVTNKIYELNALAKTSKSTLYS